MGVLKTPEHKIRQVIRLFKEPPGHSMTAIARKVGVSPGTVNRILSGGHEYVPKGRKRGKLLTVRLTDAEKADLRYRAETMGVTMQEYVHGRLFRTARALPLVGPVTAAEIGRVGRF